MNFDKRAAELEKKIEEKRKEKIRAERKRSGNNTPTAPFCSFFFIICPVGTSANIRMGTFVYSSTMSSIWLIIS